MSKTMLYFVLLIALHLNLFCGSAQSMIDKCSAEQNNEISSAEIDNLIEMLRLGRINDIDEVDKLHKRPDFLKYVTVEHLSKYTLSRLIAINLDIYSDEDIEGALCRFIRVPRDAPDIYLYYAFVRRLGMERIDQILQEQIIGEQPISLPRICFSEATPRAINTIFECVFKDGKYTIDQLSRDYLKRGYDATILKMQTDEMLWRLLSLTTDEKTKEGIAEILLQRGDMKAIDYISMTRLANITSGTFRYKSQYGLFSLYKNERQIERKHGDKEFLLELINEHGITELGELPLIVYRRRDPNIISWSAEYYRSILSVRDLSVVYNFGASRYLNINSRKKGYTDDEKQYIKDECGSFNVTLDGKGAICITRPSIDVFYHRSSFISLLAKQNILPLSYCERSLLWTENHMHTIPCDDVAAIMEIFKDLLVWVDDHYEWANEMPKCFYKK